MYPNCEWGATRHWTSSVQDTAATTKAKRADEQTSVDYSVQNKKQYE